MLIFDAVALVVILMRLYISEKSRNFAAHFG